MGFQTISLFRRGHLFALLDAYEEQQLPLDLFMSRYFREHKAIGAKDRAELSEIIYGMMRWRALLDFLSTKPLTWEKRFEVYASVDLTKESRRSDIPQHVALSFPKVLFDDLAASHGVEMASEICRISNAPAPTTVRANVMKGSRDALLAKWQSIYPVSPTPVSPNGITFAKRFNFFEMQEFKDGLFEIQDEGSQLLADLVQAEPGQQVLDYCAGAGGKTLAFAPRMQNRGQIFLHDVRSHALQDSKKRLRRAGIQNAQVVLASDEVKLKKMKKRMDWVLVDAPCTGTGTMRRNPDMKWGYDHDLLLRLVGQQRQIFEKALSFLAPSGKIVYATCSVLKEENEQQLEHFLHTYQLKLVLDPFVALPVKGGMDGFFGAVMQKVSCQKDDCS